MINTSANMDSHVMDIAFNYILGHFDKSVEIPYFMDGMYYELTYNGDTNEWYLDAYKKFENKVIPG